MPAHSAAIYHQLLDAIETRGLNANVSVKLTQMGMDFDPALAEAIVLEMVEHAAHANSFVRVDMEGTPLTEATHPARRTHPRPARPFRSRRHRSPVLPLSHRKADTDRLLSNRASASASARVPTRRGSEHAFPAKSDVDANYIKLMARMTTYVNPQLGRPVFCGLATHDERIVDTMGPLRPAAGNHRSPPSSSRCSTASAATSSAAS